MFDLVVGASSIYGGSWLEGAGAVYAENQALRWIADLVGLPPEAGGVFVPGGTIGNLSALVAARHTARMTAAHEARTGAGRRPWRVAATHGAHSSIQSACDVMDVELVGVDGRRHGPAHRGGPARGAVDDGPETFFAVVATAAPPTSASSTTSPRSPRSAASSGSGSTSTAPTAAPGSAAPSVRHLFAGIERCDSFIVDPHKWLFAPFDCCALLYREPALARAAHTQHAAYLDMLTDSPDWNPSDYAVGLTRRARGLPFWFSLATHGTEAYREAIERTLAVTRFAAEEIGRRDYLELAREPDLSVVVFRRLGWTAAQYQDWSDRLLADEFAFVVPTSHDGETLTRFAIVNPRTSEDDITAILDTMA